MFSCCYRLRLEAVFHAHNQGAFAKVFIVQVAVKGARAFLGIGTYQSSRAANSAAKIFCSGQRVVGVVTQATCAANYLPANVRGDCEAVAHIEISTQVKILATATVVIAKEVA